MFVLSIRPFLKVGNIYPLYILSPFHSVPCVSQNVVVNFVPSIVYLLFVLRPSKPYVFLVKCVCACV